VLGLAVKSPPSAGRSRLPAHNRTSKRCRTESVEAATPADVSSPWINRINVATASGSASPIGRAVATVTHGPAISSVWFPLMVTSAVSLFSRIEAKGAPAGAGQARWIVSCLLRGRDHCSQITCASPVYATPRNEHRLSSAPLFNLIGSSPSPPQLPGVPTAYPLSAGRGATGLDGLDQS